MKRKKETVRKGFTLIEIIGAIIILGIIAILAFATYTNSLKGFREEYYTRETKTMAKAGEDFFNDNRNYRPTKILNAQKVLLSTLETKSYVTKLSDYNGDACDDSSYVLVVKEDADDYSYHTCLICEKDGYDNTNEDKYCDPTWLDPTKVIYGIGEMDTAYLYKGTSRKEAMDELELPISYIRVNDQGKILAERRGTKEGNETLFPMNIDTVDTETVGKYKVTYQYGTEIKEREVVVYENEAPIVSYTKEETVATNLSGGTTTSSDTYHSGDWAQNVTVILNSKKFVHESIKASEFQWNVDGRWQNFCSTDPCEKKIERELNQTVQFRLIDTKGHASLITSPVLIKIDNTKPTCGLNITTAKGSNDWYKSDVDITFSEKLDQTQSSDNTVVSGIKIYNIQESTASLNRATSLNTNTHNTDTSGITYKGYVEDEAGNFNTCQIAFKRDATPPGCTSGGSSTTWTNQDRTITYGCSDTLSQCDTNNSGGSRAFSTTTKTADIAAYIVKDNAGNSTTCPVKTVNVYVDKTAPSCTDGGDSTSWTKSDRTITYGCSDSDSGCNSENSGGSKKFTTTTKTEDIAAYTIKDNAGNSTSCPSRKANVYVDKTAPSCTSGGDSTSWTTSDRTITYGCSDSDSGCSSGNSGGSKKFTTTTKTENIAAYTIKDNAGNSTSCPSRKANVYVGKPTKCSAGQYMNKLSCKTCEAGYYCPGGTYNPNDTIQGRTACPSGQTSEAGASSCHKICQQTEKEAICGGYCSDSEITYYKNSSQTVETASSWVYNDPNINKSIPEGKCIIKTHPNNKKVCYVFQFFRTCSGTVKTGITSSMWYSEWENSYGMIDGNNRIFVGPHFKYKGNPHCADYYAKPAKSKC